MQRAALSVLSVVILTLAVVPFLTAGKKTGGTTVAVTAEFRGDGMGVDGDRIDGDGLGAYVDGQDGVRASIQNDQHRADFVLNTENSRGRRVLFFDFTDCTQVQDGAVSCGQTPFSSGTVQKTVLQTRQGDLPSLPPNTPTPIKLHIWFPAPDPVQAGKTVGWFVRFDPADPDSTTLGCNGSYATVTRVSAANEPAVWEIEGSASAEACLLVQQGRTKQLRGRFLMPFKITVRQ